MRITIVPLLLALFSLPVLAQVDSRPLSEAEKQEKLERARSLKAEASRLQKEADARKTAADEVCYKKFLVSSCLDEAHKAHIKASREAKRLDLEGGEIERDVKRRDVAVKDAKRTHDAPLKAADQKAKGEAYRTEEADKAAARTAKAEEKERKAAAGRKKHAADQARREKKVAEQVKKDAKVAEKRRKREEKAAKQAEKHPGGSQPGSPPANP